MLDIYLITSPLLSHEPTAVRR